MTVGEAFVKLVCFGDTAPSRFFVTVASVAMALFGMTDGDSLNTAGYEQLRLLVTEEGWIAIFLAHGLLSAASLWVGRLRLTGSVVGLFIYLTMYGMILDTKAYPPMGCITGMVVMLIWVTARDALDRKTRR